MKTIKALCGADISVSDEDYPLLARHKWYIHNNGYAASRICSKLVFMHMLVCPAFQTAVTDHINGNRLDNRQENLRLVSKNMNAFNKVVVVPSGLPVGVKKHHNKFLARITIARKEINLGLHDTIEAADAARRAGELKYYGELKRRR